MAGAHRGRSRDDPVEVQRIPLGHDHVLAAAGRTAYVVRMYWRLAILGCDHLLREHRRPPDRVDLEIECGLLVLHEATVEPAAGTLMPRVAGGNGEAPRQRRLVPDGLIADRLAHGSIQ